MNRNSDFGDCWNSLVSRYTWFNSLIRFSVDSFSPEAGVWNGKSSILTFRLDPDRPKIPWTLLTNTDIGFKTHDPSKPLAWFFASTILSKAFYLKEAFQWKQLILMEQKLQKCYYFWHISEVKFIYLKHYWLDFFYQCLNQKSTSRGLWENNFWKFCCCVRILVWGKCQIVFILTTYLDIQIHIPIGLPDSMLLQKSRLTNFGLNEGFYEFNQLWESVIKTNKASSDNHTRKVWEIILLSGFNWNFFRSGIFLHLLNGFY